MGNRVELEEITIGKYVVKLVRKNGELIGAIVYGPRLAREIYISRNERVRIPKLPRNVKKFLSKNNFHVE